MHDARHSPGFFCTLASCSDRSGTGGAGRRQGTGREACGVALRCGARGALCCPGKRSTVRGPMQRAAMADAVRCGGLCTALRHLSHDAA